jgi:hypothetical protein
MRSLLLCCSLSWKCDLFCCVAHSCLASHTIDLQHMQITTQVCRSEGKQTTRSSEVADILDKVANPLAIDSHHPAKCQAAEMAPRCEECSESCHSSFEKSCCSTALCVLSLDRVPRQNIQRSGVCSARASGPG